MEPTTSATTGLNTISKMRIGQAYLSAVLLAFFLELILGIVSPKIIITIVRTSVESQA